MGGSRRKGLTMGKGEGKGFGAFSDEQVATYKECFKLMDIDKDGVINKSDLRASFDNVGTLMNDAELDSMLPRSAGRATSRTCCAASRERCPACAMTPMT